MEHDFVSLIDGKDGVRSSTSTWGGKKGNSDETKVHPFVFLLFTSVQATPVAIPVFERNLVAEQFEKIFVILATGH